MKQTIKILGLVLTSVCTVSAISASVASAADFHASSVPMNISGSNTTTHSFVWNYPEEPEPNAISCKTVTFSGVVTTTTKSSLTLTPNYSECSFIQYVSGTPITIFSNVPAHENGCGFVFHASGTTEVECPSGKKIEFTVPGCTYWISPQHLGSGMTFDNNAGKTDITATANVGKEVDLNECGTVRSDVAYTGATTVSGAGSLWYQ